jgi:hypothetical protein
MFLNLILEQIENKARANTIRGRCTASVFPSRLRSIFCGFLHRLVGDGSAFAFRN